MPNTTAWDKVPVHAWYYKAPGVPDTGTVQFRIIGAPNGVKRTDGRAIYRAGATFTVTVGDPAQQDSALLATLKAAYKARDAAILGAAFNGTTWDAQWAAALPAMICTGFYAQNDPDITPQGWQVEVTERLGGGTTGPYPIPLTVAMIDLTPVPGLNLATIELPAGTPFTPAPTYAKGQPGGVAALDSDGDVVDATGAKVIASGGGVTSVTNDNVATGAAIDLDKTADSATRKAMTSAERTKLSGVATGATANATDAQLRDRTTHTGLIPSSVISDFTEAAQDAVAAMLAGASGVTLSYNDAANTLTISGGGAGGLDAEAVRDTIGVALIGAGLINVVVNDAADTITITTTATANDTDANLRARGSHTGTQAISTVSGLQTALDGKAATTHTHAATDITSGLLALAQAPAGTGFYVYWNGTAWTFNGATITSRPTARTDLTMTAIGNTTRPTFGLANIDLWMKEVP